MKTFRYFSFIWLWMATSQAQLPDLGGVKVSWEHYSGPAAFTATSADPFQLRVQVDRRGEARPLTLRVELPNTGRNAWPVMSRFGMNPARRFPCSVQASNGKSCSFRCRKA